MPSPFSKGAQNADRQFGKFADGQVILSTQAMTTSDIALGIAHGLSSTPDFVLFSTSQAAATAAEGLAWTANATTLTFLKVDTQNPATFSYIYGNLT